MKTLVIFSDLDGTLLDSETYSFEAARDALNAVKERDIPLIFVSSKTAKEILHYRNALNNCDPFISENGGGIFIPKGYFRELPFWLPITEKYGFDMIGQGIPYSQLVEALNKLKSMNFQIRGFSDMSVQEIQEITGLSEEEAFLSKERDFDEPLIFDEGIDVDALKLALHEMGLKYTSGKYLHIIGNNDKGKAVKEVRDMFRKNRGEIVTVGIGDNINDIPMFLNVDYPIIVKKKNETHDKTVMKEVPNIRKAEGIGPDGFNTCVLQFLGELDEKT